VLFKLLSAATIAFPGRAIIVDEKSLRADRSSAQNVSAETSSSLVVDIRGEADRAALFKRIGA